MLFSRSIFSSLSPAPEINTEKIAPVETTSEAYSDVIFFFIIAWSQGFILYHQTSNTRRTKSQHFKFFRVVFQLSFDQSIEVKCEVEIEDAVWAASTGDAPTTYLRDQ